MRRAIAVWLSGLLVASAAAADHITDAKALFFDRQYAEAREAWAAVQVEKGNDPALYWVARCSELLGEHERALDQHARFLAGRPRDPVLAEEARTSRVGLATRLYKAGVKRHLPVIVEALEDPSRTVRYFAALQLSTLGREVGQAAVPVLRRIAADERDGDLVERAKIALLRLDPKALSTEGAPPARPGVFIHVRIREKGEVKVSARFPLALAELVFKSLPDDARRDLRRQGYEAESFLGKLRELGPSRIVDIRDGDGETVEIWIE
jgi:HEAT repeat protein